MSVSAFNLCLLAAWLMITGGAMLLSIGWGLVAGGCVLLAIVLLCVRLGGLRLRAADQPEGS